MCVNQWCLLIHFQNSLYNLLDNFSFSWILLISVYWLKLKIIDFNFSLICYIYDINLLCVAKLTADHHNGVTNAGCYRVSHVLVVWLYFKEQKNSELWEVFLCARAHGLKWNVSGCLEVYTYPSHLISLPCARTLINDIPWQIIILNFLSDWSVVIEKAVFKTFIRQLFFLIVSRIKPLLLTTAP